MADLYKVTFTDGEPFCRFDGELGTDDWYLKTCGIVGGSGGSGDIDVTDDHILTEDVLYIKGDINIFSVLQAIGTYYAPEPEYDPIPSSGRGAVASYERKKILGTTGAFVVWGPDSLKNILIKPWSAFKEDWPKFNQAAYEKIQNSLAYFDEAIKEEI